MRDPATLRVGPFDLAAYAAVAVAFSPVIVDLARAIIAIDGRMASLLAPVLLVLAARFQKLRDRARPGLGSVLIGLGVCCEWIGIFLDSATVSRIGLPLAAVGMGALRGWPGMRQTALLFWVVPIPVFVVRATSPWLESFIAARTEDLFSSGFGLDVHASGPLLLSSGWQLELFASDTGIWLAFIGAELGWFMGVLRGEPMANVLTRAGVFAIAALPLQIVGTWAACALLVLGHPIVARGWLDWGMHAAVIGVVLASVLYGLRRTDSDEDGDGGNSPAT